MSEPFATHHVRLAGPARMAFSEIALAWSLNRAEQDALLGQPVEAAFAGPGSVMPGPSWPETLERVSYLVGIYAVLHTLFSDNRQANDWVRRPNTGRPFYGASALALMCSGRLTDLAAVRDHLEFEGLGPI